MSQQDTQALIQIIAIVVFSLLYLGVICGILYYIYSLYKKVPEQFRRLQPGLVWLMLIPCFGIVWIFFILPRLSESYRAAFEAAGDRSHGNCNEGLAYAAAILYALSIIPYLNCLTLIPGLIILIIYLVKMGGLSNELPGQY